MAISADMQKIKKLLNEIPEDRQPLALSLYDELTFMQQTMAALKKQVQEEGAVHMFTQGQNTYPREHPALTAYNKTIQRYNQTFKQMGDLLPKSEDKPQSDELMDFIKE